MNEQERNENSTILLTEFVRFCHKKILKTNHNSLPL